MFQITYGKGFHIEFENGYRVSVQFGGGNYCGNYDMPIGGDDYRKAGEVGCFDAEVAVLASDGEMIKHPSFDNDTVGGGFTPAMVLELLNWAASQEDN